MKIRLLFLLITISVNMTVMAQTKIVQTAGHDQLGDFVPEFAHLNDDILFGEVWKWYYTL